MDLARRSDVDPKSDGREVGSRNLKVENKRLTPCFLLSPLAFLLLFAACAGSPHPPAEAPGSVNAPSAIELQSEVRAATLHFPAGIYTLSAADRIGYYYRSSRGVIQHSGGGPVVRQGGIFVSKRNPTKLRGYVYFGGAVTHVGNLSHARYEFRN